MARISWHSSEGIACSIELGPDTIYIGHARDCAIRDKSLLVYQAEISWTDTGYYLSAFHTSSGELYFQFQGKQLTFHALRNGDVVRVGSLDLRFEDSRLLVDIQGAGRSGTLQLQELVGPVVTLGTQQGDEPGKLQLAGTGISAEHAKLILKNDELFIVDLNSATGTFLNGRKISKPSLIGPRDDIQIGQLTIRARLLAPLRGASSRGDTGSTGSRGRSRPTLGGRRGRGGRYWSDETAGSIDRSSPSIHRTPTLERRELDVLLTGEVAEGAHVTLTVWLRLPASPKLGQGSETFSIEADASPVDIRVAAEGFSILSKAAVKRAIPAGEDAEPAVFVLGVLPAARRWIEVSIFQDGGLRAQFSLTRFSSANIEHRISQLNAEPVDLVISVAPDGRLAASSPRDKENLSDRDLGKLEVPPAPVLKSLQDILKGWHRAQDGDEIERRLKLLGAHLAKCLPDALRRLLHSERIRTVLIRHEARLEFPFELVFLQSTSSNGFFLADRLIVCRWLRDIEGAPGIGTKDVRLAAVLLGQVGSAHAAQGLFAGLCAAQTFDRVRSVRNEVLSRDVFQLIHFVGHCGADAQNSIYIELADGPLQLMEIGFLDEERQFGKAAPIVVLNGCGTSRPEEVLMGTTSFPERFIESGASAFIGTLWPVEERVAHAFSMALYKELLRGKTLGQALLASRQTLLKATQGPDGAPLSSTEMLWRRLAARSYCSFVHPSLRVAFEP